MFVHPIDHLLEQFVSLGVVGDGFELLAEPEPDRALEAHPSELAGRPCQARQRRLGRTTHHRLGPETVGLARDHRDRRNRQIRAGGEQA